MIEIRSASGCDKLFRIESHSSWFETVEEMQAALDGYLVTYNTGRPHQVCGMLGRMLSTAPFSISPLPTTTIRRTPCHTPPILKPLDLALWRGICQPITVFVHFNIGL